MADTIRIGKISSINYANGTARITYEDRDGSTTAEMPFLAWEYKMPSVGDQVLVAHLSNGTCAAVILGPVWHSGHRPPEGREGVYRKDYTPGGEAYEKYEAGTYSQVVPGSVEIKPADGWGVQAGSCTIRVNGGSVEISGASGVAITAAEVKVTGDLQVAGAVTASGDVVGGGISLGGHTHTSGQPGSATSAPN